MIRSHTLSFNLSTKLLIFIFSQQIVTFLLHSHGVVFYSLIVVWVLSSLSEESTDGGSGCCRKTRCSLKSIKHFQVGNKYLGAVEHSLLICSSTLLILSHYNHQTENVPFSSCCSAAGCCAEVSYSS